MYRTSFKCLENTYFRNRVCMTVPELHCITRKVLMSETTESIPELNLVIVSDFIKSFGRGLLNREMSYPECSTIHHGVPSNGLSNLVFIMLLAQPMELFVT